MTDSSDADLLNIFWIEVKEYLEALNNGLLQVEMLPEEDKSARQNVLREMNRVAHSMKGAARAVGINLIETLAHYMEEIFGAAQNDKLTIEPDVADVLYDGVDLIQQVVAGEENDSETVAAVLANMERIIATIGGEASPTAPPSSPPPLDNDTSEGAATPPVEPTSESQSPAIIIRPVEETIRVTVSKLDRLMAEASELLIARMHSEDHARHIRQLRQQLSRWGKEWRTVRAAYIRLARRMQDSADDLATDLSALFKFLETNQRHLTEFSRQLAQLNQQLAQDNMQLSALADQLQNDIGAMRMMPFETVVGGFQRMVRDLARELNKQIELEITGAHVEVDKAVLDALKDPLMHIIRNAIDHGIELPADRQLLGKPPVGRIHLWVEQRGGEMVIGVQDDGRGIDSEMLRRRIVEQQLLTVDEVQALSDDEVRAYIFHTGLTTSRKVTHLSGRGIGMDIVRDRVESLRGRISVQSEVGKGTTMLISVPVSLTRLRCILLSVGGERYAVPSAMVVRMEKVPRENLFTAEGRLLVEINQRNMPLVSLADILQTPQHTPERDLIPLLVLSSAERFVAFEVDELESETELVLKPVGREIINLPFISGAALLGNGEVVIVLDANDLVRAAMGMTLPRRRERVQPAIAARPRALRVLVVDDSITTRTLEKNILDTAGFDVYVAIDGQEAWAMINEMDFDVIISDVEMPNMNGLELTRRIKETLTTQHIPVILLTSLAKPEQREAGLRAGADAYLVKSQFDQGELLRTIQSVI